MAKIINRNLMPRAGTRATLALTGLSAALVLSGCAVGAFPGSIGAWLESAPGRTGQGMPDDPSTPAIGGAVPGGVSSPVAVPGAVVPALPAPSADPTAFLATFTTRLAGANEVPLNVSMGTGTLDALLDRRTGLLRWKMTLDNLSGAPTVAHFHGPAEIGANAAATLAFSAPVSSPYEGRSTLSAVQMADLLAGKWYANVHTAKYPNGELRGQMVERK